MTEPFSPGWTTAEAYEYGKSEGYPMFHIYECVAAANNWKNALDDHGHTSFWGYEHIRAMRAYWLGKCRHIRANQPPIRKWRKDWDEWLAKEQAKCASK